MSKLVVSQIEDSGGASLLGRTNAIINGNFGINQRGVSGTVTLAAGAYGHDRWKAGASGCTYTFATTNNVTTLTISAGSLIQVIEGINLFTGTYVLSWAGTAQGKIGAGSFGNSGITGSVTGGTNLNIEFGTGTVSLVKFEAGTVATPFEHRSYGQELALCQRYFQTLPPSPFRTAGVASGGVGQWIQFSGGKMRAAPTLLSKGISYTVNASSLSFNNTNTYGFAAEWSSGNASVHSVLLFGYDASSEL
jgi:hypothetical protein